MAIEFPNLSRSYDETRRRVRFSGYDGTREIHLFVEEDAIWKLEGGTRAQGGSILMAFDRHRKRICEVATAVYRRHRDSTCSLTTTDFS